MTREEILALEAGPALDALIAEKVMGWKPISYDRRGYVDCYQSDDGAITDVEFFIPSSGIESAYLMEEEIERRRIHDDYVYELVRVVYKPEGASIDWEISNVSGCANRLYWLLAHASPADRCKAALLTVMESV